MHSALGLLHLELTMSYHCPWTAVPVQLMAEHRKLMLTFWAQIGLRRQDVLCYLFNDLLLLTVDGKVESVSTLYAHSFAL